MLRKPLAASLTTCLAVLCVFAATASANGVVRTDKGPVRGLETPALSKYLGIPFAAPPVGDLRWRPPQAPARWREPRDATKLANHCPQHASPFGFPSSTEDCLYLNVFTPGKPGRSWRNKGHQRRHKGHKRHKRHRHDRELPVMVWLHGGGLTVGESDDYDPTRLVREDVVVVTLNYRLGYLGFLAHPALSAESGGRGSGNYGLMDQQAALRWVQRNIERFGGDDDNVTIFGQSAGGLSVHSQLASPRAKGLFDRAIAQSGAYTSDLPSLTDAETSGTAAASTFGCTDQSAACLRSAPLETILSVQPTAEGASVPNIDGNVFTESIGSAIESGNFNRVPVIEGTTHDEFTIFEILYVESLVGAVTEFLYPTVVGILDGTLGLAPTPDEILAQYPVTDYSHPGLGISAIGTDAIFACPARRTAGVLSRFVRTYQFELDDPNAPQLFIPPGSIPTGSYHAAELAFLFDSDLRGGHAPFSADQEALAATMVGYWTRFAHAGSPNRRNLPQWPRYSVASDTHMSFVPPTPQPKTGFAADHKCAFWDSFEGSP